MPNMAEIREMCIKFWSENPKGRDCLEDLVTDRRIILYWTLGK